MEKVVSLKYCKLGNGKHDILSGVFPVFLVISARHKLSFPTYTENVKDKHKKRTKKNKKKVFSKLLNQISSCLNILETAEKRILWTFVGMTSLTSNSTQLRNFITSWNIIKTLQNFVEVSFSVNLKNIYTKKQEQNVGLRSYKGFGYYKKYFL